MNFVTSLIFTLSIWSNVKGHSSPLVPIHTYDFVHSVNIEILPQYTFSNMEPSQFEKFNTSSEHLPTTILPRDYFRLTLNAFNSTIFIHFEPNSELIHPDAVVNFVGAGNDNGNDIITSKPLSQLAKVYRGLVYVKDHSESQVKLHKRGVLKDMSLAATPIGSARLTVFEDGEHQKILNTDAQSQNVLQHISHFIDPVFEGVFDMYGEEYHIQPISIYENSKLDGDPELPSPFYREPSQKSSKMIIYRNADRRVSNARKIGNSETCGSHKLKVQGMESLDVSTFQHGKLFKRAAAGCPTSKKIAYLGFAADCSYFQNYKSLEATLNKILSDVNQASQVYESTFNIQLGVVKLDIQQVCNPNSDRPWNQDCSVASYDLAARLSDFSKWRGTLGEDGTAIWHLMTACSSGTTVGLAWPSQVCNSKAITQPGAGGQQFVSGTSVSSIAKEEWLVVAHEIGHNFGAIHDCTSKDCPCSGSQCNNCCPCSGNCDCNAEYIMNPTSDIKSSTFSPCSIQAICTQFPQIATCLKDPGSETVISSGMCGNGIKEGNEQCDCGTEAQCANDPCCTKNCTLKPGCQCSDSNSLCCNKCQFTKKGSVCRPSKGECDFQEVCPGNSGDCPADLYKDNGSSCGSSGETCATGVCTSRADQCNARGSVTTGIKGDCKSTRSSCDLTCGTSDPNSCLQLNGYFRDGTPCGIKGFCNSGACQGDLPLSGALLFIYDNPILLAALCILFAMFLLSLCCACCRRCRSRKGSIPKATSNQVRPMGVVPSHLTSGRAPVAQQSPSNWVDPSKYNGQTPIPPDAAFRH